MKISRSITFPDGTVQTTAAVSSAPPLSVDATVTLVVVAGTQPSSVIPTVVDGCIKHDGAWVKNP